MYETRGTDGRLFLHGSSFLTNTDKHGGSRRVLYESHESDEYYLYTENTELTEALSTRILFLHGYSFLTNTEKHGGSRRVLYESHESQEYYLCTEHGELTEGSFYTDDSFYTDYINEHGTARRTRMLFCPVRISRI